MFPIIIKVTGYSQSRNYCDAVTIDGQKVAFDPFVSCCIELPDEDYSNGKGADVVGRSFAITEVSIQPWSDIDDRHDYMITPLKMTEITHD